MYKVQDIKFNHRYNGLWGTKNRDKLQEVMQVQTHGGLVQQRQVQEVPQAIFQCEIANK